MRKISKILSVILTVSLIFSVVLVPTASASEEVYLTDLVFDGYTVQDFDKDNPSYIATLPYRDPDAFEGRSGDTPVVKAVAAAGCTAEVETTKNTVTVTVSKDGAESKVYTINYTVVGANLLKNPGFETPNEGSTNHQDNWARRTGSNGTVRSSVAHGGSWSNYWDAPEGLYQSITVSEHWYYITSAWARGGYDADNKPENAPIFYMASNGAKLVGEKKTARANSSMAYIQAAQVFEMTNETTNEGKSSFEVSLKAENVVAGPCYSDDYFAGVLVAGDIKISGAPASITTNDDIQLSAQVVNQMGNTDGIENQPTVSWRKVSGPEGATVDLKGKVSINKTLGAKGTIVIEATAAPNWGTDEQKAYQSIIGSRVEINADVEAVTKASVKDIVFDGYSIPDFAPGKTTYNVVLPYRHYVSAEERYNPTVSAVAADGGSCEVGKTTYNEETKTGTVTITATEPGLEDNTITINYSVIGDNMVNNPSFETGDTSGWMGNAGISDSSADGNKSAVADASGYDLYQTLEQLSDTNLDWVYLTSGQIMLNNENVFGTTFQVYSWDVPKYQNLPNTFTINEKFKWTRHTQAWQIGPETVEVINRYGETEIQNHGLLRACILTWTLPSGGTFYVDDFYAGPMVAAGIDVTAPKAITSAGSVQLSGSVINQLGTTYAIEETNPTVSYRLVEAPAGVEVSKEGLVTVSADAEFGKIVVEATAIPNWGPETQKAAQTVIGKRIEIYAAVNAPCEFTYAYGEGTVTPTVNWFNKAEVSKTVRAYTAVYENVNGAKKLKSVISNEPVTIGSGELYNVALTSVAWTNGEEVKSFLLADGIIPVMPAN